MNTAITTEDTPAQYSSWQVLIGAPLRQAAVLLWLVGAWRLWERVLSHQITVEWVVAASVATLAAFLLIAQMRWLWLAFVPVALGLGVVLGVGHQFDTGSSGLLTTLYALSLWVMVPRILALAGVVRIGQALELAGGHGASGGRARIQMAIHGTGLTVVGLAIIGVGWRAVMFGAPAELDPLWTLALGAVFFWMTGWYYQHRLHSYLVIGSVICGLWLSVAHFEEAPFGVVLLDGDFALPSLGLCFGFSIIAMVLERWRGGLALSELTDSLYRRALRIVALWLAAGVAIQQLYLGWIVIGAGVVPGGTVFVIAGLAVLLANHALALMRWSAAGVILIAIGGYGALYGWIASGDVAVPHSLAAALLALAGVVVAWIITRSDELEDLYLAPLRFVVDLAYAGALVSAGFSAVVALDRLDFLLTTALLLVTTFPVVRGAQAALWRGLILAGLSRRAGLFAARQQRARPAERWCSARLGLWVVGFGNFWHRALESAFRRLAGRAGAVAVARSLVCCWWRLRGRVRARATVDFSPCAIALSGSDAASHRRWCFWVVGRCGGNLCRVGRDRLVVVDVCPRSSP